MRRAAPKALLLEGRVASEALVRAQGSRTREGWGEVAPPGDPPSELQSPILIWYNRLTARVMSQVGAAGGDDRPFGDSGRIARNATLLPRRLRNGVMETRIRSSRHDPETGGGDAP